jgi:LuxR family glucitol operon transcriptional activator
MESDLRLAIREVAERSARVDLLPLDVRRNAAGRWEKDNESREGEHAESDIDLLDYADFADLAKILHTNAGDFSRIGPQTVHHIADRLVGLAPARNRVCHSRPLEPDDFAELYDLARELSTQCRIVGWPEIDATLTMLESDPSFVLRLVIPTFWSIDISDIHHNLPDPEFDDTGFLGRVADRKEVHRLLASPHPVVTIVGEGGVGKTALGLRCLYDLLEKSDGAKFDAIIWISLKTKALTPSGVRRIKDSIASTLGLVQRAASVIGIPSSSSPQVSMLIDELRDYMQHFRILLAIDNFETLASNTLRPLLSEIPHGSKVLITSRAGLGEIEVRYKLDALDARTAVLLARGYARTLNLRWLAEAKEAILKKYCGLLYNNPLLIKWFISSVAVGGDPARLLEPGGKSFRSALQFCFESLFNRLTPIERGILLILVSAKRPLTQAELYFLASNSREEVDWAVNALHRFSMLQRAFDSRPGAGDGVTLFALTELAAEYVTKYAPPSSAVYSQVQASLKKITQIAEIESVEQARYKYSIFSIRAETRDERISAAFLRRALNAHKKGDLIGARKLVKAAKSVLPTFSEAFRISAIVESDANELFKADEEYETAIDLDPSSTIAKYSYAQFLLKFMDDSQGALEQLDVTLREDPGNLTLLGARALTLTRLGQYKEAAEVYEKLLKALAGRPRRWRIVTRDQAAECYRRWLEQDRMWKDPDSFWRHFNRSLEIIEEGFRSGDYDQDLVARFGRVLDEAIRMVAMTRSTDQATQIIKRVVNSNQYFKGCVLNLYNMDTFREAFADNASLLETLSGLPIRSSRRRDSVIHKTPSIAMRDSTKGQERIIKGKVLRLTPGTDYGFIEDEDKNQWFFHRNALSQRKDWSNVQEGEEVVFKIGRNKHGPCATQVAFSESPKDHKGEEKEAI